MQSHLYFKYKLLKWLTSLIRHSKIKVHGILPTTNCSPHNILPFQSSVSNTETLVGFQLTKSYAANEELKKSLLPTHFWQPFPLKSFFPSKSTHKILKVTILQNISLYSITWKIPILFQNARASYTPNQCYLNSELLIPPRILFNPNNNSMNDSSHSGKFLKHPLHYVKLCIQMY